MEPHAHIAPHYDTQSAKRRFLDDLFDRAAVHYERTSQLLSMGSGRFYRRFVLGRVGLRDGMQVLDVASGTGPLARAATHVLRGDTGVIALEPSSEMIAEGRKLTRVPFVRGVAESLPFASARFDLVTMGYALRHVSELELTFREFHRVLRPGGRLVILEISRPASPTGMRIARLYFARMLPRVTRLATRSEAAAAMIRYYWETIATCVPPAAIVAALRRAGFDRAWRRVYFGVSSEYHAVKSGAPA